jgi:hypothetical protein
MRSLLLRFLLAFLLTVGLLMLLQWAIARSG